MVEEVKIFCAMRMTFLVSKCKFGCEDGVVRNIGSTNRDEMQ